MRIFHLTMVWSMFVYMSMFAGVAMAADTGVGVCAAGIGFSINDDTGPGPYAGANAGTNSETGVYDNNEDFETQCCAETGQAPDCFDPVG